MNDDYTLCRSLRPDGNKLHIPIEQAESYDAQQVETTTYRKHVRNYLNSQGIPLDLTRLIAEGLNQ